MTNASIVLLAIFAIEPPSFQAPRKPVLRELPVAYCKFLNRRATPQQMRKLAAGYDRVADAFEGGHVQEDGSVKPSDQGTMTLMTEELHREILGDELALELEVTLRPVFTRMHHAGILVDVHDHARAFEVVSEWLSWLSQRPQRPTRISSPRG